MTISGRGQPRVRPFLLEGRPEKHMKGWTRGSGDGGGGGALGGVLPPPPELRPFHGLERLHKVSSAGQPPKSRCAQPGPRPAGPPATSARACMRVHGRARPVSRFPVPMFPAVLYF